jgi:hypothetical protein
MPVTAIVVLVVVLVIVMPTIMPCRMFWWPLLYRLVWSYIVEYHRVSSCLVHTAVLSPGYRSLTVLLTTPKYLLTSAGIPFPLRAA